MIRQFKVQIRIPAMRTPLVAGTHEALSNKMELKCLKNIPCSPFWGYWQY
jgi:hypothetical protein